MNRSASDIKAAISKGGGKVGGGQCRALGMAHEAHDLLTATNCFAALQPAESGSVMFGFLRCGCVIVDNTTEDAVFETAMEAGAVDIVPVETDEDGAPSTSYKVGIGSSQAGVLPGIAILCSRACAQGSLCTASAAAAGFGVMARLPRIAGVH